MEIVLLQFSLYGQVPELMTFEGRNFDILIGITAPIIGYLVVKHKIRKKGVLMWNTVGLVLILSILVNGYSVL